MPKINLEEVNELITEVGLPCDQPESLMRALNIFFEQYETIKKNYPPSKRTEIKKLEKDKDQLLNWHDANTQALLGAYTLIEHNNKTLQSSGVSESEIKTSLFVLLKLLAISDQETTNTVQRIEELIPLDSSSDLAPDSLMLYGILPKIYEDHFDRNFGVSYSDYSKEVSGPGVRFIQKISLKIDRYKTGDAIKKGCARLRDIES